MNILIPGGEGYVGKVTTSYLLKKKHFVRSLDLMLYKQDALKSNEKTILRYEFIFGDRFFNVGIQEEDNLYMLI